MIYHLRTNSPTLQRLMDNDLVVYHPLVIEKIACGNMRHRAEVLEPLAVLPDAPTIDHEEFLAFLETHKLFGQGLGWIDVHLLASTNLQYATLRTLDQPARQVARIMHCQFESPD